MKKLTLAHVTHEAVEKIGGIGTVLEGLITSPIYQKAVGRSILIGPCSAHMEVDPQKRLGEHGTVLYSSVDGIDELGLASKLHPIEWAFNTALIYGRRTYDVPGDDRKGEADVLLIDVFTPNVDRLGVFKLRLFETFGIDSHRYEHEWGYEEYVRLAEPSFYALRALLKDEEMPCVMFSHEFMGMPACLKAVLDGQESFRTVFHAHECATARHIVENHPGHDVMFYNAMKLARKKGMYVGDTFGDLSYHFRHALISRSHLCDGVIAVGDYTAEEMHFLGRQFDHHQIDLVYNGVPEGKVTPTLKQKSREMLLDYSEALLGHRPDILMTHVTRPVISKGLWRDAAVCHYLDQQFAESGETGVLFILTSGGGTRRKQDIRQMEEEYGWPRQHREGYPDLSGPEVDINHMVEAFNAEHEHVQIVLVNQFGWSRDLIGKRVPKGMDIADLRRATDVEFGMATYEPFGISPLEPLNAGAICVISEVCGCMGFVKFVTDHEPVRNVLIADYTQLEGNWSLEAIKAMTTEQRDAIESGISEALADELNRRIPRSQADRNKLVAAGQKLAKKLGWDEVCKKKLIPMLERVVNGESS